MSNHQRSDSEVIDTLARNLRSAESTIERLERENGRLKSDRSAVAEAFAKVEDSHGVLQGTVERLKRNNRRLKGNRRAGAEALAKLEHAHAALKVIFEDKGDD